MKTEAEKMWKGKKERGKCGENAENVGELPKIVEIETNCGKLRI